MADFGITAREATTAARGLESAAAYIEKNTKIGEARRQSLQVLQIGQKVLGEMSRAVASGREYTLTSENADSLNSAYEIAERVNIKNLPKPRKAM